MRRARARQPAVTRASVAAACGVIRGWSGRAALLVSIALFAGSPAWITAKLMGALAFSIEHGYLHDSRPPPDVLRDEQ